MLSYETKRSKSLNSNQLRRLVIYNNTVLGPIPLKVDSSAFISSMDKLCKYSMHNLPLLFDRELNTFLMQEAFVDANPPHLMASSMHLDSAERTYNKMQSTNNQKLLKRQFSKFLYTSSLQSHRPNFTFNP